MIYIAICIYLAPPELVSTAEEIHSCSRNHFDLELVEVFLSMFDNAAGDEGAADTI